MDPTKTAEKIAKFERLMEAYIRRNPAEEALERVNKLIDAYNKWLEREQAVLDNVRETLQKEGEAIEAEKEEVSRIDKELDRNPPDRSDPEAVKTFSRRVEERNRRAKALEARLEQHNQRVNAHNEKSNKFGEEVERRKSELEGERRKADAEITEYNKWIREEGPAKLSRDVNALFGGVCREARSPNSYEEASKHKERLRGIRYELGLRAKRVEESSRDGLLIVECSLALPEKEDEKAEGKDLSQERERAFMLVDNGSQYSSVTPEMVEILGIGDHVGGEVTLNLAGGIQIKAPEAMIPRIAVLPHSAKFVKGVVLKESMPGVDGTLGLSFLNRFDYTIRKGAPATLELGDAPAPTEAEYDVFICHRSEDESLAREVCDLLKEGGFRPFLYEEEVPKADTSVFLQTVDDALEVVKHMVVVTTSRENVVRPWVKSEYCLIDGLIRTGRRRGKIVTVRGGSMPSAELPITLQRHVSVSTDQPNWKTQLLQHLGRR